MLRIRPFRLEDSEDVIRLWRECDLVRPWNDPQKDIERKLTVQPELFIVAENREAAVIGTAMIGYEGHRGWVYYLAVKPACQEQGVGRALMHEAESLLLARGCPKIQLLVRAGNSQVVDFYEQQGYEKADVFMLGKRLIPDS